MKTNNKQRILAIFSELNGKSTAELKAEQERLQAAISQNTANMDSQPDYLRAAVVISNFSDLARLGVINRLILERESPASNFLWQFDGILNLFHTDLADCHDRLYSPPDWLISLSNDLIALGWDCCTLAETNSDQGNRAHLCIRDPRDKAAIAQ